jgi:hypothetical protein
MAPQRPHDPQQGLLWAHVLVPQAAAIVWRHARPLGTRGARPCMCRWPHPLQQPSTERQSNSQSHDPQTLVACHVPLQAELLTRLNAAVNESQLQECYKNRILGLITKKTQKNHLRRMKIRKKMPPFWAPTLLPRRPSLCCATLCPRLSNARPSSHLRKVIFQSTVPPPPKSPSLWCATRGQTFFFFVALLCFNVGFPCSLRCL